MDPIKPPVQAFSLPDLGKLLHIQLDPSDVDAIVTVIGLVLKTLGIPGLADVVSLLLKMEQSWAATQASDSTTTPKS